MIIEARSNNFVAFKPIISETTTIPSFERSHFSFFPFHWTENKMKLFYTKTTKKYSRNECSQVTRKNSVQWTKDNENKKNKIVKQK